MASSEKLLTSFERRQQGDENVLEIFARPKFSFYQAVGESLLECAKTPRTTDAFAPATYLPSTPRTSVSLSSSAPTPTPAPATQGAEGEPAPEPANSTVPDATWRVPISNSVASDGSTSALPRPDLSALPVGLEMGNQSVPIGMIFPTPQDVALQWDDFHLRRSASAHSVEAPKVLSVYLPLLAQVMHVWDKVTGTDCPHKRVLLVCGAGRPVNRQLGRSGNSTHSTAELMLEFLKRHYPHVTAEMVDSGFDVFSYTENINFVRKSLLPRVEALRRECAYSLHLPWRDHLRVTIALTVGASARLAALQASLRLYSPTYIHMWQTKTFWHERRMDVADVQLQSFESIETLPAVPVVSLEDQDVRDLVREVAQFKESFEGRQGDELAGFWLRKTKKPVLSVLLVQSRTNANAPRVFLRGINCEVSMPTGSLCAERNVIGAALARDPTLRREDLRMLAVLSLPLHTTGQTPAVASQAVRNSEGAPEAQASAPARKRSRYRADSVSGVDVFSGGNQSAWGAARGGDDSFSSSSSSPSSSSSLGTWSMLHASSGSHDGGNPISPCGACVEWLRKIAEVNPDFRVITFASSACDQVFVKEVELL